MLSSDEKAALYEIRDTLNELLAILKERKKPNEVSYMDFPDHLRKTILALIRLGEGTAQDVASITKRARAVESGYLNQLAVSGHAIKLPRRKREQYFRISADK